MVATAHLFSAPKHDTKAIGVIAGYYFGESTASYYSEKDKVRGAWFGGGVSYLNLPTRVVQKHLFNLLRGRDPEGKADIVRTKSKAQRKARRKGDDRCGIDLTLSAPKSVSALWAFSSPEQRLIIEACFDRACRNTLKILEENCKSVRRGKGGDKWSHGKLLFAMFDHHTARNNEDFNVHRHCIIPNVVIGEDGAFSKINMLPLLRMVRGLGPLLNNNLLAELTEALGVRAYIPEKDKKKADWFELEGFSKKFLRHFSSRSREIDEKTEVFGTSNSHVAARQNANLLTRKSKRSDLTAEQRFAMWDQAAGKLGFDKRDIQAVIGHSISPVTDEEVGAAIQKAIESITSTEACFDCWQVIRKTSELLQDRPVRAEAVVDKVNYALGISKDVITVKRENHEILYSTKALANIEKETIGFIDKLANRPGLAVPRKFIELAVSRSSVPLSEEQKHVVRHILSQNCSIASILGYAGSGKTTVLRVLVDALELSGKRVLGAAIGGTAVDKVRESINRESRTVASFLYGIKEPLWKRAGKATYHHLKMYARAVQGKKTWARNPRTRIRKNDTILLDEVSMVDTSQLHPLIKEIERVGAQLICIGDTTQLPPIGPGNPLEHINARVEVATLQHNWRQTPAEAQAALMLRQGKADEALKIYAAKGDLVVATDRLSTVKHLLRDWADEGSKRPEDEVILAQTNHEVELLNRLCQAERLKRGELSGQPITINDRHIYKRDRVVFRATDSSLGIKNGYRGTVIAIGRDGSLTVRVDQLNPGVDASLLLVSAFGQGKSPRHFIKLAPKQAVKLDMRLGYASTTHSFQGSQTARVHILLGGKNQNLSMSYVQLTRAQGRGRLYVDRAHAGPELSSIIDAMNQRVEKKNIYEHRQTHTHSLKPE